MSSHEISGLISLENQEKVKKGENKIVQDQSTLIKEQSVQGLFVCSLIILIIHSWDGLVQVFNWQN